MALRHATRFAARATPLLLLSSSTPADCAMVQPLRNLLSGIFASMPDPIDYTSLRGLPKSFGFEAGEAALKGEVPEKSKDGYSIATFAGGCFWGTELHYQRLDGVIATYAQMTSTLGLSSDRSC